MFIFSDASRNGDSQYLQNLEKEIPDLLQDSRAANTASQYDSAYARWLFWLIENNKKCTLPCEPKLLVLYLLHLSKTGVSMSVLNLAIAAIAWKHTTLGFNSPCESNFVKEAIAGLKHRLAKPRSPKEPLALKQLHSIIDSANLTDLTELRNVVFFTLSFYAFLRFEEAVSIRFSHIVFCTNHFEILIPSAKNDQLQEGNKVVVAKMDGDYCPYKLLKAYLDLVGFKKNS